MKCCLVPSTSCDLCTGKIWRCCFQKLMRRCVYKKIHYLTLTVGSRSHKTSPSTLDIMWPMHRQNLKLLLPKVYEEMHLQKKTLFDLWPWPWGQGDMKCHPVPSSSCDLCIYKVWGCYVLRFRRRYNYKKRDWRTDRRTDGRTDRLWYEINIPYFSNEKAGIIMKIILKMLLLKELFILICMY